MLIQINKSHLYKISFQSYHMKLTGGVKVHQDDDDVKNYIKADLNDANRLKSNIQKEMDDMLFGSRPVRRRGQNNSTANTPNKPKEEEIKTPQKSMEKKEVNKQQNQTKVSPQAPKPPVQKTPITNRYPPRNTQKTERSHLSRTSQKTEQNLLDSAEKSQPLSRSKPRNTRFDTERSKKHEEQPKALQLIQEGKMYNRPAYIRKLKKAAGNFNYHTLNENHKYFDVIRSKDCLKETALSQEAPNFTDMDFPHTSRSVSFINKKQSFEWTKANKIYRKIGFGRYIDPNDIEVGKYSSKKFVSVLSCLAERQENIKRLIENQNTNNNGFYFVRLNINAVWKYFSVDDYLPSLKQESVGVRSYPDNQSQLCFSLIQKAYAKAYGSYDIFARKATTSEHYLRDLTGAVVTQYEPSQQIKDIIEAASKNKWTIIGQPKDEIQQLGLSKDYNICIKGLNNRKNVELRNSWGSIVQKPDANLSKDGIFQLKVSELSQYFKSILIAETDDELYTSTIQSKHQRSFYSCYTFSVKKAGKFVVGVCQWDHKLFPEANQYKYSPFHLVLEKREKDGSRKIINGGYTANNRNIDVESNLQVGNYGVYCFGSWQNRGINYHITVSGTQCVEIKRIHINESLNEITKCMEEANIANDSKKAKGAIHEYTFLNKQANVIVLTVINTSDKNQNHNQDFSKWKNVSLISTIGPNQSSARLEETKKKSVNISLKGKQSYSWVIAPNKQINNLREVGLV